MLPLEQHLDNLMRHIDMVRSSCILLGKRLIAQGRLEFGRMLIARGYKHDFSKFFSVEFEYLHAGKDVSKPALNMAMKQHQSTNDHHCAFWGGFENMPEICIAEASADMLARAQEFGTDLRDYITDIFVKKHKINTESQQYRWLMSFVDILTENEFVDDTTDESVTAELITI